MAAPDVEGVRRFFPGRVKAPPPHSVSPLLSCAISRPEKMGVSRPEQSPLPYLIGTLLSCAITRPGKMGVSRPGKAKPVPPLSDGSQPTVTFRYPPGF